MRDQFRKEYNKHNAPGRSGAAADNKSSCWTYFASLLFLAKQIAPKPLSGNLPSDLTSPTQENESDLPVQEVLELSDSELSVTQPGPSHLSQPSSSTVFQPETPTSQQNTKLNNKAVRCFFLKRKILDVIILH